MATDPEEVRMTIRRVVDESGLPQAVIARDADLSYAAIRAWLNGERTPEPTSIRKLASGLRSRGDRLLELADDLEREVEE